MRKQFSCLLEEKITICETVTTQSSFGHEHSLNFFSVHFYAAAENTSDWRNFSDCKSLAPLLKQIVELGKATGNIYFT